MERRFGAAFTTAVTRSATRLAVCAELTWRSGRNNPRYATVDAAPIAARTASRLRTPVGGPEEPRARQCRPIHARRPAVRRAPDTLPRGMLKRPARSARARTIPRRLSEA